MLLSQTIACLLDKLKEHGDMEVHAYPGWDTDYPITEETIEYYSSEVTGDKPYILITGSVPEDRS